MAYNLILSTSLSSPTITSIVIADGNINTDTPLRLAGRGSTDYINNIQENILHLLENFSSVSIPTNSVEGMSWFNSQLQLLHSVNPQLQAIDEELPHSGASIPTIPGRLWYNSTADRLYAYNGTSYVDTMQHYLLLTGGTITNDFIINNLTRDNNNQPVMSIVGNLLTDTLYPTTASITATDLALSGNCLITSVANESVINLDTVALSTNNSIVLNINSSNSTPASVVGIYQQTTSTPIITFGATEISTFVPTSVTNTYVLDVDNSASAQDGINLSQLTAVLPTSYDQLLLLNGTNDMIGQLSVYNLVLSSSSPTAAFVDFQSRTQLGGVTPIWRVASNSSSIFTINHISGATTTQILKFTNATDAFYLNGAGNRPITFNQLGTPVDATDGCTKTYLTQQANAVVAALPPTRRCKAWAKIEKYPSTVKFNSQLNMTSVSINNSNGKVTILSPYIKATDTVIVSPCYYNADLITLGPSDFYNWKNDAYQLDLWEVELDPRTADGIATFSIRLTSSASAGWHKISDSRYDWDADFATHLAAYAPLLYLHVTVYGTS